MSIEQRRIAQYELQDMLTNNRLSELWKAFDVQKRRYVTIELLYLPQSAVASFAPRFLQEGQRLTLLQHANIAPILDAQIQQDAQNSLAYVVTEYVEGTLLSEFLSTTVHAGTFLESNDVVQLLAALGNALDYAHQQGITHGALQPDRIVLDKQSTDQYAAGNPKLLGFGLQHLVPVQALPLEETLYLSPERARGATDTPSSDIYALAALLYELSTGTQPFQGDSPEEVLTNQIQNMPTSPTLINPRIRPALTAVIMRGLAKEPVSRFSRALALVAATARALQVSIQDIPGLSGVNLNLTPSISQSGQFSDAMNTMNSPTYLTPSARSPQTRPPIPYPTSNPGLTPAYPPQQSGGMPVMTSNNSGAAFSLQNSQPYPRVANTPSMNGIAGQSITGAHTVLVPPAVSAPKKRNRLYFFLIPLLIVILVGSSLGIVWLIRNNATTPPTATTTTPLIGQAFFTSSGQLNPNTIQGTADGLQIALQRLPAPAAGKSYYVWLRSEDTSTNESQPILVGKSDKTGEIDLTFQGDTQHNNLLADYGRLLITQEDTATPPNNPSLDPKNRLFGAEFSNIVNTDEKNAYSLLGHMRHLLAQDPKLKTAGLTGGLDIWLFNNTLKILETAGSIRDSNDTAFIQRQLVRILNYLDGSQYMQNEKLPPGIEPVQIDPTIAKVAMLNFDPQQNPPGYLKHIGNHLQSISTAPKVTAHQKQLAIQINIAINNVQSWMEKVHSDAQKLIQMPLEQLRKPEGIALLDDLFTQANTALVGQADPNTNQIREGVIQIHHNIQRLATFDILPCSDGAKTVCA